MKIKTINVLALMLLTVAFLTIWSCSKDKIDITKPSMEASEEVILRGGGEINGIVISDLAKDEDFNTIINKYFEFVDIAVGKLQLASEDDKKQILEVFDRIHEGNSEDVDYALNFLNFEDIKEAEEVQKKLEDNYKALVQKFPALKDMKEVERNEIFEAAILDVNFSLSEALTFWNFECEFKIPVDKEGNLMDCPNWYTPITGCRDVFTTCSIGKVTAARNSMVSCGGSSASIWGGFIAVGTAVGSTGGPGGAGIGASIGLVIGFYPSAIIALACVENVNTQFYQSDCPSCRREALLCCLE